VRIEVDRLDGRRVMAIADRIAALYRSCYRRPPWSETPEQMASYDGKLAEAAARPGFTALTAAAGNGRRRLLGVCYGWPTPALSEGDRVHDAVTRAFGAARAAELIGGAFAVAELFVHPDAQGQGIGRRLVQAVVRDRPAAWLITYARSPAARLYRSLGWRDQGPLPADLYPRLRLSLFTLRAPAEASSTPP